MSVATEVSIGRSNNMIKPATNNSGRDCVDCDIQNFIGIAAERGVTTSTDSERQNDSEQDAQRVVVNCEKSPRQRGVRRRGDESLRDYLTPASVSAFLKATASMY
jgi:hypothetical protein